MNNVKVVDFANFELDSISLQGCSSVTHSDGNAVCIRLKQFTWRLIAMLKC